jgi:anti-anti-sigma factor
VAIVYRDPIVIAELLCTQLLDETVMDRIAGDITDAMRNRQPPLLIISFARVQHLSSMALRTLLNLRRELMEKQGQIRLAAIRPEIREVFATTRLDTLFQIHSDTEEAVAKMQVWLRLVKGNR